MPRERRPATPYPGDKVPVPAIEPPPGRGCSLPNLRPSEVPTATLRPRFPYLEITAQGVVCHAHNDWRFSERGKLPVCPHSVPPESRVEKFALGRKEPSGSIGQPMSSRPKPVRENTSASPRQRAS